MWRKNWRNQIWSYLDEPFDLVVIGGGITGAGIFSEATRRGYKTILIDANDFASGTSSRSSKLVHGGFRYLRNGQLRITYDSVRERERLLREERGLINELGFLIAKYKGDWLPMWALGFGLTVYDLIAFRWGHKYYAPEKMLDLCQDLNSTNLQGGYRYFDALTDDARLVLKTIKQAVKNGGLAINYCAAEKILRSKQGQIYGLQIVDTAPNGAQTSCEVKSRAIINATGVWAEDVCTMDPQRSGAVSKLRKLQGSHLVFRFEDLPLSRAVSIWHPKDKRPVFAFPWEGVTVVGTTDVDATSPVEIDPAISPGEYEYLLEFVQFAFPGRGLDENDVQSTFSGFRSVVDTGKTDPSKESREHILNYDNGLLTVSGGKLTTFNLMAQQALNMLEKLDASFIPNGYKKTDKEPPNIKMFARSQIETRDGIRLIGRYGDDIHRMIAEIGMQEFQAIEGSQNLWAELRWAARNEGVVHLDDLLLRRLRLGILLPGGGVSLIQRIKHIIHEELSWSDQQWEHELKRYFRILKQSYSVG